MTEEQLLSEVDRLQRRVAELEGLLRRLTEYELRESDEMGPDEFEECLFCDGSYIDNESGHTESCAWVAARAALEQGK